MSNDSLPSNYENKFSSIQETTDKVSGLVTNNIFKLLTNIQDPTVKNNSINDKLTRIMEKKKENVEKSPFELGQAEKNLYLFNKGESGGDEKYNSMIVDRYATTAADFKKNTIDKQQKFAGNLLEHIKQYEGQLIFIKHSESLLKIKKEEKKMIEKKINRFNRILQTNERKVVYEEKDMESLFLYRRIMLFIYYTIIVGYVIFGNFIPDKLYKKYTVWLLLFIASIMPIILNLIIKWIFVLYDVLSYWFEDIVYKDVYNDL